MPLTVVVGGQYGSEGKGKLTSYLAAAAHAPVAVVRCGGPNAGHTAEGEDGRYLLRQLPSGAVVPGCELLLAAGMQLDLKVIRQEIEGLAIGPDRLLIDERAVVIEEGDRAVESHQGLFERIGSTLSGTGAAAARKVLRDPSVRLAGDVAELRPFVGDVAARLHTLLNSGAEIIVEGSQGAGLSLHHGHYPYATGRDTTAAAFLSESGLPPALVTDVVVVFRTYPIRVGGSSGPLAGELDWEEVARRANYPTALAEYTTVSGRLRRVGEFDWELAQRAVMLNGPSYLAVHGVDYLNHADLGRMHFTELSERSRNFIAALEAQLEVPVRFIFTGADGHELIDRGSAYRREPRAMTPASVLPPVDS